MAKILDFETARRQQGLSDSQEIDRALAVCWAMILVFCGSCLYGLVMLLGWTVGKIAQVVR